MHEKMFYNLQIHCFFLTQYKLISFIAHKLRF